MAEGLSPPGNRGRDEERPGGVQLFSLARALGQALTAEEVAKAVFEHAIVSLGARTVGLWLLGDDDVIRFAGGAGHDERNGPGVLGDIPLDSDTPGAIALRTRQLISYGSKGERDARWPSLAGVATNSEATAVVPLTARGRQLGCLHVGWVERRDDFLPDTKLLWGLADLCATALDRARLFEGERRARETLEFLNQGTRLMVSALNPEQVVRALVELAVPRLAPWCAVYVARGDHLERVAIEISIDPELAGELRNTAPVPLDSSIPLATAYRTGRRVVVKDVSASIVTRTYPPAQARKVLALPGARWGAIAVPVQAGGEVIGVMSLVSPSWGSSVPSDVVYAAEELAARAGVALRHSQRYWEQVENVRVLTAALLPEGVPVIDGLRFAARYVPASGGVCGDWYEAELTPTGEVLVGVGDASGHGLAAAATMARVRHAARGLAVAGIGPGVMLDHLGNLLAAGVDDSIATSVYGLIDVRTGAGRWASAGHPPPIVARPGGTVQCMEIAAGPPIGFESGQHPERSVLLDEGGRIVLYTDGLFERRGEDPAVGIERLIEVVASMSGASEDEIADAVIAGRGDADDTCVLVIGR